MSVFWSIISIVVTALIVIILNSKNDQDKDKRKNLVILNNKILQNSMIIGLLVFGHLILDLIGWPMSVINPDVKGVPFLFNDAVNIGFGVYSTWFGALLMDIGMFVVGIVVYLHFVKKVKKIKLLEET